MKPTKYNYDIYCLRPNINGDFSEETINIFRKEFEYTLISMGYLVGIKVMDFPHNFLKIHTKESHRIYRYTDIKQFNICMTKKIPYSKGFISGESNT